MWLTVVEVTVIYNRIAIQNSRDPKTWRYNGSGIAHGFALYSANSK